MAQHIVAILCKGSRGDVQPLLAIALGLANNSASDQAAASVLFFTHEEHRGWIAQSMEPKDATRVRPTYLASEALACTNDAASVGAEVLQDVRVVASTLKAAIARLSHTFNTTPKLTIAFNLFAMEGLLLGTHAFPGAKLVALAPYLMPRPAKQLPPQELLDSNPNLASLCDCRAELQVCSLHHWLYPMLDERWDAARQWLQPPSLSSSSSPSSSSLVVDLRKWSEVPLLYGFSEKVVPDALLLPPSAQLTGFWRLPKRCDRRGSGATAVPPSSVPPTAGIEGAQSQLLFAVTLGSMPTLGLFSEADDSAGAKAALLTPTQRSVMSFLVGLAVTVRDAHPQGVACLITSGFGGYVDALRAFEKLTSSTSAVAVVADETQLASQVASRGLSVDRRERAGLDGSSTSTASSLLRLLADHLIIYDASPDLEGPFFSRCAGKGAPFIAIVHHGGSGTTSACLFAGVPQIILPLMLDQFQWRDWCRDLGVSPAHATLKAAKPGQAAAASSDTSDLDLDSYLDACEEYYTAMTELRPTVRLVDRAAVERAMSTTLAKRLAASLGVEEELEADEEASGDKPSRRKRAGEDEAGSADDDGPLAVFTRSLRMVVANYSGLREQCAKVAAALRDEEATGRSGAAYAAKIILETNSDHEATAPSEAAPCVSDSSASAPMEAELEPLSDEEYRDIAGLVNKIVSETAPQATTEEAPSPFLDRWSLTKVKSLRSSSAATDAKIVDFGPAGLITGGVEETAALCKEVFVDRDYDGPRHGTKATMAWVEAVTSPVQSPTAGEPQAAPIVIVDAGANVGLFTLHVIRKRKEAFAAASKSIGPSVAFPPLIIVAVEPVAVTCALLIQNLQSVLSLEGGSMALPEPEGAAGAGGPRPVAVLSSAPLAGGSETTAAMTGHPNVTVLLYRAALTDDVSKKPTLAIQVFPRLSGNSTAKPLQKLPQRKHMTDVLGKGHLYEGAYTEICPTTTIAELLLALPASIGGACGPGVAWPLSVALLKVDVEGSELDVLKGAILATLPLAATDDSHRCPYRIEEVVAEVHDAKSMTGSASVSAGGRLVQVMQLLSSEAFPAGACGFPCAGISVHKSGGEGALDNFLVYAAAVLTRSVDEAIAGSAWHARLSALEKGVLSVLKENV